MCVHARLFAVNCFQPSSPRASQTTREQTKTVQCFNKQMGPIARTCCVYVSAHEMRVHTYNYVYMFCARIPMLLRNLSDATFCNAMQQPSSAIYYAKGHCSYKLDFLDGKTK